MKTKTREWYGEPYNAWYDGEVKQLHRAGKVVIKYPGYPGQETRLGHIAVVLYGTRVVVAGTWSGRFLADFDPAYPIQANFSEISARCARRQIFNQILRNTDLGQYVRSALVCAEASS